MKSKKQETFPLSKKAQPEIQIPRHARRLEKALLYSLENTETPSRSLIYYLLNYFTTMSFIKKFALAGLASFMIIAAVASNSFSSTTPVVNAQTILKDVYTEVNGLPPDTILNLNEKLQTNVQDILIEAKTAKDLKYCNKEDCKIFHNNSISLDGRVLKDRQDLNLLEFTDSKGNTVFVASNKENVPEFVLKVSEDNTSSNIIMQFTPGDGYKDDTILEVSNSGPK